MTDVSAMNMKSNNGGRKRKIVEIAATPENEANSETLLLALCDDGSVWWCVLNTGQAAEWQQLDEIPQE